MLLDTFLQLVATPAPICGAPPPCYCCGHPTNQLRPRMQDESTDTHCAVGWSDTTCVVAFRWARQFSTVLSGLCGLLVRALF